MSFFFIKLYQFKLSTTFYCHWYSYALFVRKCLTNLAFIYLYHKVTKYKYILSSQQFLILHLSINLIPCSCLQPSFLLLIVRVGIMCIIAAWRGSCTLSYRCQRKRIVAKAIVTKARCNASVLKDRYKRIRQT